MNGILKDYLVSEEGSISIIGRILGTEYMRSLLRLAGKYDKIYLGGIDTMSISHYFCIEDFDLQTGRLKIDFGLRNDNFLSDLSILATQIENFGDVKDLFNAGFLDTESVRHLFGILLETGKLSTDVLSKVDGKYFGYNDREMQMLKNCGFVIQSFSDSVSQLIDNLL